MDANGERMLEYAVDTFGDDNTEVRVLSIQLNITCWTCQPNVISNLVCGRYWIKKVLLKYTGFQRHATLILVTLSAAARRAGVWFHRRTVFVHEFNMYYMCMYRVAKKYCNIA
jgi:hypothetical protein